MVSVKILLKEAQPKKDGTYAILLRITADRRSKYISTGYFAKKNQFRDGMENWVHHHPDAHLINAGIEKKRSAIMEKVYAADIAGTAIDIKVVNKPAGSGQTFIKLLLEQQTIFEKRNQVSAFDKLSTRIKNLKAAWGRDLQVSEISKYWVDQYVNDRYAKNASPNTIRKDLQIFSSVLQNYELLKGKNYFREAQKKIIRVPVQKVKLTLAEIKLLEEVKLYNMEDVARDMFLFSYYTQGMRFQSVALFKRENIKTELLQYRMNKGKKLREVILHPKLIAIIEKYLHADTPYLFPVMKKEITDVWELDKAVDVAGAFSFTNCHTATPKIWAIAFNLVHPGSVFFSQLE